MMTSSIDRAGRVVIPKDVRERLGLVADTTLQLDVDGETIRLTPVRPVGRRIVEVDGWPVIESRDGARLTDLDVQRSRDGDQR